MKCKMMHDVYAKIDTFFLRVYQSEFVNIAEEHDFI